MLNTMNPRWFLYLSVLETEIIEAKINFILDSLTFKYSRQPEMLSLIPDRMAEINLRLASTVKIINDSETGGKDQGAATSMKNKQSFYKDVYGNEQRASDLRNIVESVMHIR